MKYTLITSKGKVYTFFVRAVAETYLAAYGGNIITGDILVDQKSDICYNNDITTKNSQ
jgi:hypothetical protein